MIEMVQAKEAAILQIQYLLVNHHRKISHLLNTVIYGPPGVGKTRLATILARIWIGLGVLQGSPIITPSKSLSIEPFRKTINQIRKKAQTHHNARSTETRKRKYQELVQELDHLEGLINPKKQKTTSIPNISVVSREDLVAEYVGQTAPKTLALLNKHLGSVLVIDEAYALVQGHDDHYGFEALTCLNKFLSEHPGEIIVILVGYRDLIQENLFRVQPGLERRMVWTFEISGYPPKALAEIFKQQLAEEELKIQDVDLSRFLERNRSDLKSYAGDTKKLAYYCQLAMVQHQFRELIQNQPITRTLTEDILSEAFRRFKENQTIKPDPIPSFYS